jgi:sialate O-acetylesterase
MLRPLLFPVAAFGSLIVSAAADVRLPALFSDHMVLQREMAVPVWGWADPGEEVTVKISGQTHSTKADGDGKWKVTLEAMRGEEAVTMTVVGKNTVTIDDVLVGEVWLASGQSNMQMQVNASKDAQKEKRSFRRSGCLRWGAKRRRFRRIGVRGSGWFVRRRRLGDFQRRRIFSGGIFIRI